MASQLQQAFLDAILGPNPLPFETLIVHLMSPSNVEQSGAESVFNFIKQNYSISLALKLINHVSSTKVVESRGMSAILLRKGLNKGDSFICPKLDHSTHLSVKVMLLRCIQIEESKSMSKKLCDTVSELASLILPVNGCPELLLFSFKCVTSDYVKLEELAFLIFSQLEEYLGKFIRFVNVMRLVFLKTLSNSSNIDVNIAALSATANFVRCLLSPNDHEKFQELSPLMMRT